MSVRSVGVATTESSPASAKSVDEGAMITRDVLGASVSVKVCSEAESDDRAVLLIIVVAFGLTVVVDK